MSEMRCRKVRSYGERGVEQENTLIGPPCQSSAGLRYVQAQIGIYFLENVYERRRAGNALRHRKAQPVCLTSVVVGILTENDNLHLVERRVPESRKNVAPFRKTLVLGVFRHQKLL